MKKRVQFGERKELAGKPYSVVVAVGIRSDTGDRNTIKRSMQKFLDRLERKSVGVKGGLIKIEDVRVKKVIGTERTIDWFAGMWA